MLTPRDIWAARQRARFMRPDATRYLRPDSARYVRHDAGRFMPPGTSRLLTNNASGSVRRKGPAASEAKYSPSQPRVPAGNTDGGQWTTEADGLSDTAPLEIVAQSFGEAVDEELRDGLIQLAQFNGSVTDADGNPYYRPGGHDEMPRGVYSDWDLPPETQKIFEQSTTGTLPRATVRTTPEGIPFGNTWTAAHQNYSEAVQELSDRFFERSGIEPEQMTPTQAQTLLKEIRESPDPRIRDFNINMRLLQRLYPFRSGRGTD